MKSKEAVVKVDSELMKKVERLISLKDKRIRYASKKQFVDIAVLKLLEEEIRKANNIKSSSLSNKKQNQGSATPIREIKRRKMKRRKE